MIKLILKKHTTWSVLVCQWYLLVKAFYCSFFLPAFEQTLALFNLQYFIFSSGKTLPVPPRIALPLPRDPPALATAPSHMPLHLWYALFTQCFSVSLQPVFVQSYCYFAEFDTPDTSVISPAQHWCSKNEPSH